MVLFVSRILEHDRVYSLELSDGWYAIRTSGLDQVLTKAVSSRKIVVGTKLMIQGTELVGIEEGCSPLEVSNSYWNKQKYSNNIDSFALFCLVSFVRCQVQWL